MSDTVKLIIEIPTDLYEITKAKVDKNMTNALLSVSVANGIPLDDVKNKILDYNVRRNVSGSESFLMGYARGMDKSAEILDNIGKAESEGK